jgi:ankyrin repeat protein
MDRLTQAIMAQNSADVKSCLNQSIDSSVREKALLFAIVEHAILKLLLESGVDPNSADEFGQTALQLAVDCSIDRYAFEVDDELDLRMIKLLLQYGASPYAVNLRGETAIDWARNQLPLASPILHILEMSLGDSETAEQ